MATLEDVSKIAGVSKSTVSRVVRGEQAVSARTRARVLEAIDAIGYRPNELARGLMTGSQRQVAVIVPDIRIEFFSRIVHGVEEALRQQQHLVLILNSGESTARLEECIVAAKTTRVAGLVVVPAGHDRDLERVFSGLPFPVVSVSREPWTPRIDAVSCDNREAGYLAGKHLLELGHRAIAYLEGPRTSKAARLRTEGFKDALREYGYPFLTELSGVGDLTYESGTAFGRELIAKNQPFTAVFAANDPMAVGVIDELSIAGIRVPEDVSVIGVDGSQEAARPSVRLTTVLEAPEEMGKRAAVILHDRIRGWDAPPIQVKFHADLVWRATTRAIATPDGPSFPAGVTSDADQQARG